MKPGLQFSFLYFGLGVLKGSRLFARIFVKRTLSDYRVLEAGSIFIPAQFVLKVVPKT